MITPSLYNKLKRNVAYYSDRIIHFSAILRISIMINYSIKSGNESFMLSTDIHMNVRKQPLIKPDFAIVYVTGGSGMWQIGDELCPVHEGDLVFLSNLEPRQLKSLDGFLDIETLAIKNTVLTSAGVGDCLRVYYARNPGFTHAIHAPSLVAIFDTIRREAMSVNPSYSVILAHTILLLTGAGREYDCRYPGTLEQNFRCDASAAGAIAASAAYINANLTADLRVEELAKLANMSTRHYTRMFRKYVSVTPVDYIARCRVKRFLTLYSESKGNVLDTAFACGFTSASGFYKAFRRICGHSPSTEIDENGEDSAG